MRVRVPSGALHEGLIAISDTVQFAVTQGYDPAVIEPKWQRAWRDADAFRTPAEAEEGRAQAHVLNSHPFTSGAAHMGHVRSYSIGDSQARYRRARGDAVLYSLGFDAFG